MNQILNLEILKKSDPKLLFDQGFFIKVEDLVYEVEAAAEPETARQTLVVLADLINKAEDKNETLTKKYFGIIIALRLVGLMSTSDQEKEKFLAENLVPLLKQGYADLNYWLKLMIDFYRSDAETVQTVQRALIRGIESNLNFLGTKDIKVKDQMVKPFVKNWLLDFNSFPSQNARRGALEETSYINQSANVRALTVDEQKVLRKILHIYDWVRFHALEAKSELLSERRIEPTRKPFVISQAPPKPQIAQVPEPVNHGLSIDTLKTELKTAPVLNQVERKYVQAATPQMTPQEIKREVAVKELPAPPVAAPKPAVPTLATKPVIPPAILAKPIPPVRVVAPPVVTPAAKPVPTPPVHVEEIKFVDDLKKISPASLRAGVLSSQVTQIKSKIAYLASVNRLYPYEVVNVFEQSPLFKLYLRIGGLLIGNPNQDRKAAFEMESVKVKSEMGDTLTLEEFEAVADLKKEIERM